MRLSFLPILLLPTLAMAQTPPAPPAQDQPTPKQRATEAMLIEAMRDEQQHATAEEMLRDTVRDMQQQMLTKAKEAADKDAELKKRDDQIKELSAANDQMRGQLKQQAQESK